MLKIVVLDNSAESRSRITERLNQVFQSDLSDLDLLPNLSVKPLSLRELKFNSAPDICIVGDEISSDDSGQIATVRKHFPQSAILVSLGAAAFKSLAFIEQLIRLGADDVFASEISSQDLLRKIVIWARKAGPKRKGKLVLFDSAKGGTGVTTTVATLGEILLESDKKVALLDMDFDTQDLSRFLQARPFTNENLQLLLDGQRPVSQEFVAQCLSRIWAEDELYCMSPAGDSEVLNQLSSTHSRVMMAILETLDADFDCVLVDIGSARGPLLRLLYRVADKVVLVLNNDPATLYASVDRFGKIKTHLASPSDIVILENCSTKHGLPNHLLRKEFNRAAGIDVENWSPLAVPFCRFGSRWPGSGSTLANLAKSKTLRAFEVLLAKLELVSPSKGDEARLVVKDQSWWERLTVRPERARIDFRGKGSNARPLLELPQPENLIGDPRPEVTLAGSFKF